MALHCACDPNHWFRLTRSRRQIVGGAAALAGAALLPVARGPRRVRADEATPTASVPQLIHGEGHDIVFNDSFISPLVELYGNIEVGHNVFIAGNTILFAGEELMVSVGDDCNCQDNAYLLATTRNNTFGMMNSIAHQAVIEDSIVGDFAFFGFRSRTRHCEIGSGAMIMHNTTVENVRIPENRITPVGAHITTQAEADALPEITPANVDFKHAVQEVNHEFVTGYQALYAAGEMVEGIGPNPVTSFNPLSVMPTIGDGTVLRELVRIVGDVQLGEESIIGQRTAIRADEGTPIIIGRRARIGSRVTFHALEHTTLSVGDNAWIGDESVLHGPLTVGHNVYIEDQAVVFQATVGDNVTIRRGATIAAPVTIPEGAEIGPGMVILTQEDADALPIL